MDPVKCFFLRETGKIERYLRRYSASGEQSCPLNPGRWSYHNAMVFIDLAPVIPNSVIPEQTMPPRDDPRWPKACDCGYEFPSTDCWQVFTDQVFTRSDNGEFTTLRKAPPGAMWNAWWLAERKDWWWTGPDGMSLHVRCPDGHDWCIDGLCSNCTRPNEPHKCWVRTGTPPEITVGKGKDGESCAAGAGSIQTPTWHGWLKLGLLTEH